MRFISAWILSICLLSVSYRELPNHLELFHFSVDGKFLNTIGKQGRGPEEYTDLWELTVFEDSQIIYAGTQRSRNIYKYSFDGEFLGVIKYDKSFSSPKVLSPERIAYTTYSEYEVKIIDIPAQDTQSYISFTPQSRSDLPQFSGCPHSGYYYSALGRDTIWRIDADSMRPALICDFGTGHISSQEYFGAVEKMEPYPPGRLSIGGGVLHGSGYYHFGLLRDDLQNDYTYAIVIVNEKTLDTWHFKGESDDILFSESARFSTIAKSGEWVSVVSPVDLVEALPKIQQNTAFKYPDDLVDQIGAMTIDDNPVLVLYELK